MIDFKQMGQDKVLIDFDEEAREDGYIPYAAYEEEENLDLPVDINHDFSDESHDSADNYQEILETLEQDPRYKLPTFDITSSMNIEEG